MNADSRTPGDMMPDKDLADFVKGTTAASTEREARRCPFCSADLLPRAQKCKFCGGWAVGARNARTDVWRKSAAIDGQRALLKALGERPARDVTRGDAADALARLHDVDPAAFEELAGLGHCIGKQRRFPVVGIVVLLVAVLGVAVVALHWTGASAPALKRIGMDGWLPWRDGGDGDGDGAGNRRLAANDRAGEIGVAEPVERVDAGVPEDPEYAAIARTFRPVRPNQRIAVSVRGGTEVEGILKTVLADRIVILRPTGEGHAQVILQRSDLAAWSRAMLYESDYVAYVMAKRELEAAATTQAEAIARRTREYKEAFAAMQAERRRIALARRRKLEQQRARDDAVTDAEAVESGDMSIREWMEKNPPSDALRARQERVRAFESENPDL